MGDLDSWTKEQLLEAVETRTEIGQAMGILMERFTMSADEAIEYLKRCSQDTNRKLYDVAVELIATRALPVADPPGGA